MLTEEGLKRLEEELEVLKGEKRKEIAEKIKVARSYGDLSENSEYDDAKNEQAILEARIADIEASLKNAVLIDESEINNDKVHVGSTVVIKNIATDKEMTVRIVGSNESNPKEMKISDESPVGMGLIGKVVDDVAEIETPGGVVAYKVIEILK
ncbi:MAG: transcription elongation factor GreA [Ruminococcus sp.]|nr:transcription elongation factor GreA [Ruminococcus sp.]MDD6645946.1 transcription elongation factor GreA [Oscillospiraceae bacterium]